MDAKHPPVRASSSEARTGGNFVTTPLGLKPPLGHLFVKKHFLFGLAVVYIQSFMGGSEGACPIKSAIVWFQVLFFGYRFNILVVLVDKLHEFRILYPVVFFNLHNFIVHRVCVG